MIEVSERARAVAALRFRALGDETRLRILEQLVGAERSVGELIDATALGQSLVSHHLRTLRDAGIVVGRQDGRWVYYSILESALAAVHRAVAVFEDPA